MPSELTSACSKSDCSLCTLYHNLLIVFLACIFHVELYVLSCLSSSKWIIFWILLGCRRNPRLTAMSAYHFLQSCLSLFIIFRQFLPILIWSFTIWYGIFHDVHCIAIFTIYWVNFWDLVEVLFKYWENWLSLLILCCMELSFVCLCNIERYAYMCRGYR